MSRQSELDQVRSFLQAFDLNFDGQVDYTVGFFVEDQLIATGSLSGYVLRNIAVDESFQGENLTGKIVAHLLNKAAEQGCFHTFLFTKPKNVDYFVSLGFSLLCQVEKAALLENGLPSVIHYKQQLERQVQSLPAGKRAVLVMNCNPFTNGHLALIEQAAAECASVVVLVVSEDQSAFPFEVRYRLVREGTRHLTNVLALPSGPYTVSRATFPDYFLQAKSDVVTAQTELDATLFVSQIAPALKGQVRYVGEEPYSPVTQVYNESLQKILPQHGIEVKLVKRVSVDGKIISASKVRAKLSDSRVEAIASFVPPCTYQYLISNEAKPIIKKIRTIFAERA